MKELGLSTTMDQIQHLRLVDSLQGMGTGLCTAGEQMASAQLQGGDFYVFYSKDQDGQNKIPRIAIRMENSQVAELRGVDPGQELEPDLVDTAREQLMQLPSGEKYEKKVNDMKALTEIDKKIQQEEDLTNEDIRFLYELDGSIEGFGYSKAFGLRKSSQKGTPKKIW